MSTESTDVTVTNSPAHQRYEALVEGETLAGFLAYQETNELVVLTHTEVEPSFEGRGIGGVLARAALDDIRERGLKALVVCPFVLGWLRRHPEYRDLLFNAPRRGDAPAAPEHEHS
ncbi:GNAT family N-acetyltransferase [Nocardioides ochotonae]|uniref:GNAT family N-acetyltransferase n=1 Tax=Nocardioides ochotonae TaxID=2685869 RepID=UPI001409C65D|nr:GNAT family N-acetyltransferase [Nocardioides ochotonae]